MFPQVVTCIFENRLACTVIEKILEHMETHVICLQRYQLNDIACFPLDIKTLEFHTKISIYVNFMHLAEREYNIYLDINIKVFQILSVLNMG